MAGGSAVARGFSRANLDACVFAQAFHNSRMKTSAIRLSAALLIAVGSAAAFVHAQQTGLTAADKAKRWEPENELQSVAIIDRKVMMPMRDGVRLATDIYRPKNAAGKVPVVWVRTPYNFNFWDMQNGVPSRHDGGAHGGEARLRLRRAERARAFLLRGQLRHPRRAAHRRLRRDRLDVEAAVVERQGRHDRLLVDRRVSDGHRRAWAIPRTRR